MCIQIPAVAVLLIIVIQPTESECILLANCKSCSERERGTAKNLQCPNGEVVWGYGRFGSMKANPICVTADLNLLPPSAVEIGALGPRHFYKNTQTACFGVTQRKITIPTTNIITHINKQPIF